MIFRDALDTYASKARPMPLSVVSPSQCYDIALSEALKGAGFVSENPLVGAVFVDENMRYLGSGGHLIFGGAHAEVNALADVKANGLESHLSGGTLFCTLEPCSHVGKTPACAKRLLDLGLKRVIIADLDPNPIVSGQGLKILTDSAIEVYQDPHFAELCGFLHQASSSLTHSNRVFCGLKAAVTLDGAIAYTQNERTWISGRRAHRYGHWLRVLYDGILVGANTVIIDNPLLNVRLDDLSRVRQPHKMVFDPSARALLHRPLEQQNVIASGGKTLWFVSTQTLESLQGSWRADLEARGVSLVGLPKHVETGLCLSAWNEACRQVQIGSVLLEGGQGIWNSFINDQRVDRVHLIQSTSFFGSRSVRWVLGDIPNLPLRSPQLSLLGDDLVIEGEIVSSLRKICEKSAACQN